MMKKHEISKRNALKGQHNLALGKQSVAQGWITDKEIVRAIMVLKENLISRTKQMVMVMNEYLNPNTRSLSGWGGELKKISNIECKISNVQNRPENQNALKGQNNLALGKRSVAQGWITDKEIVRAIMVLKENFISRTKQMVMVMNEYLNPNTRSLSGWGGELKNIQYRMYNIEYPNKIKRTI